jgi:hypothetical protein
LGGDISDQRLVLPALLESLPLALLTFASEQPEELEAYTRLLDLGAARGQQENFDSLSEDLVRWIIDGALAEPEPKFEAPPVPPADLAGTKDQTAAERAETIATRLRAFGESFRSRTAELPISLETSLTVPRSWELRERIIHGATSLAVAVEQQPLSPVPPDPILEM